jgi:hypothetical protein
MIMTVGLPQGPIMYQAAPPELSSRAYVFLAASQVKATLDEAEKQGAPGFDSWFPPPANVDQAREELRRMVQPNGEAGRTELK